MLPSSPNIVVGVCVVSRHENYCSSKNIKCRAVLSCKTTLVLLTSSLEFRIHHNSVSFHRFKPGSF